MRPRTRRATRAAFVVARFNGARREFLDLYGAPVADAVLARWIAGEEEARRVAFQANRGRGPGDHGVGFWSALPLETAARPAPAGTMDRALSDWRREKRF